MRQSKGEKLFHIINVIFLIILTCAMIYPVLYVISASFSSSNAVTSGKVVLFPKEFGIKAYEYIFQDKTIWVSYLNSLYYTVTGTLVSVAVTICGAYPLSKKRLLGGSLITFAIVFTLWFGAGMIPTYLNFKSLNLLNTRTSIIIGFACETFYFILMKNFFQSIPQSLEEAAKIDGANDLQILYKVYIPLSMPSIATIALFYAVSKWNSYLMPMILLSDDKLLPLQVVLKKMIVDLNVTIKQKEDVTNAFSEETFIYATIVISTLPILIFYPFIQKYFVKGVMVGAIKG